MKAIAAIDENYGIGRNGSLLIKNKEDMKFFKETTMGHTVIMGRNTYESMGRPLPGRKNIVITTQNIQIPGIQVVNDWRTLISTDAFVIGGAQIYKLFFPYCDEIYLTENKGIFDADVFFPRFDKTAYVSEILVHAETYDIIKYTRI